MPKKWYIFSSAYTMHSPLHIQRTRSLWSNIHGLFLIGWLCLWPALSVHALDDPPSKKKEESKETKWLNSNYLQGAGFLISIGALYLLLTRIYSSYRHHSCFDASIWDASSPHFSWHKLTSLSPSGVDLPEHLPRCFFAVEQVGYIPRSSSEEKISCSLKMVVKHPKLPWVVLGGSLNQTIFLADEKEAKGFISLGKGFVAKKTYYTSFPIEYMALSHDGRCLIVSGANGMLACYFVDVEKPEIFRLLALFPTPYVQIQIIFFIPLENTSSDVYTFFSLSEYLYVQVWEVNIKQKDDPNLSLFKQKEIFIAEKDYTISLKAMSYFTQEKYLILFNEKGCFYTFSLFEEQGSYSQSKIQNFPNRGEYTLSMDQKTGNMLLGGRKIAFISLRNEQVFWYQTKEKKMIEYHDVGWFNEQFFYDFDPQKGLLHIGEKKTCDTKQRTLSPLYSFNDSDWDEKNGRLVLLI